MPQLIPAIFWSLWSISRRCRLPSRAGGDRRFAAALFVLAGFATGHCWAESPTNGAKGQAGGEADPLHVVFLTGDEEYRSEESMPMLARILQRNYGFEVTVCYSLAEDGTIDPNRRVSVEGIEALDTADLMVLFLRFRDLPKDQFEHFLRYVDAGGPIVGFRTGTHAFKFDSHPEYREWGWKGEKIAQLVGQNWITHHGHFADGNRPLTDVTLIDAKRDHPILRGVEPFQAFSWLYHVEGGGDHLRGDSEPLLLGRALQSTHAEQGQTDRYPLTNPVAWTKTHEAGGETGRVFFTTLGHPYDFKQESMRKLALNGILWALGREDAIPSQGADARIVGEYRPNNSGFGKKYKQGRKPEEI